MLRKKETGKKRKLYHFSDLIKDFNFYDIKSYNISDFKGNIFYLSSPDLNKLIEIENTYHNTMVLNKRCEYAQEIKNICLFIAR